MTHAQLARGGEAMLPGRRTAASGPLVRAALRSALFTAPADCGETLRQRAPAAPRRRSARGPERVSVESVGQRRCRPLTVLPASVVSTS